MNKKSRKDLFSFFFFNPLLRLGFQWFSLVSQAQQWIQVARQQLQKTRGEDHPDVEALRGGGILKDVFRSIYSICI